MSFYNKFILTKGNADLMRSKTNQFIKDYLEVDKNVEETRLYLLILGCMFPFTEIFIEIYKIRLESELISNIIVGVAFLLTYFLTKKNKFLRSHINRIFNVIYLIVAIFVTVKVIVKPFELLTYSEFLIIIFFSYGVFRNLRYFLVFNTCLAVCFAILLAIKHFELNLSIIYLNSIITVALLSYTRHIAIRQSNQKLIFANSIVHNGTSLVIATNNIGEVLFCSNNIKEILGYSPDEVMGMGFWQLTEDGDFEAIDYSLKYRVNSLYTRKLKCKNGNYKYIQWQDNKYSDTLYVGIGQDVTEKIRIQNEYYNLIQTANDIIYKADSRGNFIFVNDYGKKILGLGNEDLLGKHFTSLIRKDHVRAIALFYIKNSKTSTNYTTQEFPIVLKNEREMWVSQNVTIERDVNNKILGFSAIVRDITDVKNAEAEKIQRQQKSETYARVIKGLTLKPYSISDSFTQILDTILKNSLEALGADRASIWNYKNNSIICINSINSSGKNYTKGDVYTEIELPNYFSAFTMGINIVADNICENSYTKDLCRAPGNAIKSLLEVPVFSNAELNGIVCFETLNNFRNWDEEDISFTRAIADIISVTYESQRRKKAEKQLMFRAEILEAIAKTTEKLLTSQNIHSTLNQTLKIIGEATRIDQLNYYELNNAKQQLELKSSWISDNYDLPDNGALTILSLKTVPSIAGQLYKNEPYVCLIKKTIEKDVPALFAEQDVLSTLILPLFIKNNLQGCIMFNDCKVEKKWHKDQLVMLNSLITNIANAIERINNENIIKESEANFRQLNETIDNVFWLYDLINKHIIYISSSSLKILGVDPEEFYKTDNYWKNYIYDEDKPLILKAHEKVEIDGFYEIEYRIKTKQGETKWIYEKSFGIKNQDGVFIKSSGICSDITVKKQTELALIESENNFRQINETIEDVFWLFDITNRKYLYISPNVEQILGIPDREFYEGIHQKRNFVFKEDEYVFKNAESWLLKQDSYEIEYRIIKGDTLRWINEKSFAIRDQNGILIRNSGICRDITEHKEAENEIRQLSLVAEKTTNGILIADEQGKTIWANQSYLELFEIELKDLVGKRPRDLFVDKSEDQLLDQIEKDNGTNFQKEFEVYTYVTKKKLWIELNSTVITANNGKSIQQIEVITDITEKIKDKNELKRYSLELEFQNTLKEKLINAADIEEITRETLGFIKSNINNCVRISLLSLDEKKQNLSGYLFNGSTTEKVRYNVKDFKSFDAVRSGNIFVERDLLNSEQKSSSDEALIRTDNARSYIILPIMANNALTGTLNIGFDRLFELNESEIENLQSFSSLLSVALQQLNLKNALLEKNKDNTESLMYAKNIQNTILPNIKTLLPVLKDVCLLFKPRDIVSGDFYWATETDTHAFIAVADCTGHGVPGSFLTLIGSKILDQIITAEKLISPAEILTKLDENLFNSLNVKKDSLVRDGMEIALCAYEKKTKKLIYSGSGLGLVYFIDKQEFYIRGQVKSIGDYRQDSPPFEDVEIDVTGGEVFFMATDGYQDQLGGEKYKRLSKKRTIDILNNIQHLLPSEQETILENELEKHIGNYPQTDDITILGFKIKTN